MKRKNPLSENATKGDLKILESLLRAEIKLNTDEILTKVDDKARNYRDQILTSNDKLAKTLETIREDLEIGNFQTEEKIKDHEKRISHLEKAQQAA